MKTMSDYGKQIEKIAALAKRWRLEHPSADVRIQFNFQRNVFVAGCISDALAAKFVSCNDAGLELLKAISDWGTRDEATVFMVRAALEEVL